jgi:hypothetical protein
MDGEFDEDALRARLSRGSKAYAWHVGALIAGISSFAAVIFTGYSRLLFPAGVCFVLAGCCAISGGQALLQARGHGLIEHLTPEARRPALARGSAVLMGALLMMFGLGVLRMAVSIRLGEPRRVGAVPPSDDSSAAPRAPATTRQPAASAGSRRASY